jgi:hypothetical protein
MKNKTNVVSINRIDETDTFALVPGYKNKKKVRKIKELKNSKGNCYFTNGISRNLINFIFRAVTQLKIKDKKLIFSRGAVKINGKSVIHAAGLRVLDWDAGISIRIPHKLNYNKKISLLVDDIEYNIRLMETITLSTLLRIAFPRKTSKWYTDMSVLIITKGWKALDIE